MMNLLRHLFTPHHTNNHRAKALHIDALAVYVVLFAVFNFGVRYIHRELPQVLGYATNIYADQLLSATNVERTAHGLKPLAFNSLLAYAASLKAEDMFAHNYWAHNSPQGKTPWEFISAAGYKYTVAGENLAKNFNDSAGVIAGWMGSPTHRDNILKSSYKEVGFAVVNGVLNGEETTLVVQMFGSSVAPIQAAKVEVPKESAHIEVSDTANELSKLTSKKVVPMVEKTVLVPEVASDTTSTMKQASVFSGVSLHPMVNLGSTTHALAYGFVGFLLVVFALDAYLIARRKTVRITGHNIAHILFLISITIAIAVTLPGSIL